MTRLARNMTLITYQVIAGIISFSHHEGIPIEGKTYAEVNEYPNNSRIQPDEVSVFTTYHCRFDRSLVLATARSSRFTLSHIIFSTRICQ